MAILFEDCHFLLRIYNFTYNLQPITYYFKE